MSDNYTIDTATQRPNRYNQGAHYLPAVAPGQLPARAYPLPPAVQQDTTILDLSSALAAQNLNERTTPFDRALGFAVRVVLLVVLLGGLAYGLLLVILYGDGFGLALLLFSALASGGYVWLNQLDYAHSPAGVEREKIQAIERVALDKQRGERALRREILRSYLRSMEGDQGHG
jgi:hypothetical protein